MYECIGYEDQFAHGEWQGWGWKASQGEMAWCRVFERFSNVSELLPVSLTKQRAAERNGVAPWRTQKKAPFQKKKYQSSPIDPTGYFERAPQKALKVFCFPRVFQLTFRYIAHINTYHTMSLLYFQFISSVFSIDVFEPLRESFRVKGIRVSGYPRAGSSAGASPPISSSLTPHCPHCFHWVEFRICHERFYTWW